MFLCLMSQEKSGVPLVAHEKFSEPKEVEVVFNIVSTELLVFNIVTTELLMAFMTGPCIFMHNPLKSVVSLLDLVSECFQKLVITPVKKELGLAFKGNQKKVVEALEVNCLWTECLHHGWLNVNRSANWEAIF